MISLSVIMLAWIRNEELYELTNQTLQSFGRSDGQFELVVVDNGSPIGGDQLIKVSGTYVRNSINVGYPKGVNQGVRVSKGKFLAIANNDIKVSPNWIKVTEEVFEKLPKTGSLHFKMVGYDEPFNLSNGVWETGRERWCHGSFFVIRRDVIEKIGYYDENYGLGGYDDWDLQKRIRDAGYSTVYTNGAGFQHKDSSTLNTLESKPRADSDNKNREYFKKKFGTYPEILFERQFGSQLERPWRPFP